MWDQALFLWGVEEPQPPIRGLEWAHSSDFNVSMHCSSTNSHTSHAEYGKQNLPAKKPALHPKAHEQPGVLSLAGMGLDSHRSLEQLGEAGMDFQENSRYCVRKKEKKPCLWTTLGARIHFSSSDLLKHQQWPTFGALVAHWQTHQSSRASFSFVYLHKFPYGMKNQ